MDEFNAIVNHKLDIEIDKIANADEDEGSDKEGYWPLFGDSLKTILPMNDDESDENQVTSQEV